jgi:hypothetical protein
MIIRLGPWIAGAAGLVGLSVTAWAVGDYAISQSSLAADVERIDTELAAVANTTTWLEFSYLNNERQRRELSPTEHQRLCALAKLFEQGEVARAAGCL